MTAQDEGRRVDEFYASDRIARMVLDHQRRLERLEEEMDTARALIAQQIKLNLERPRE